MAAKITPRLIELTYEAALKSYWRRNALRKFLIASQVSSNFVEAWSDDESKRDLLDRLFQRLQTTEKGKAVIFQMARSLSEQSTFPDLRNWEDSAQKIQDAHKAVQELKSYLKQQDEEVKCERERLETQERARAERERIQRSLTDKTSTAPRCDAFKSRGARRGVMNLSNGFTGCLIFAKYKIEDHIKVTAGK